MTSESEFDEQQYRVFRTIFENLFFYEIIPLRLVCRHWKKNVDKYFVTKDTISLLRCNGFLRMRLTFDYNIGLLYRTQLTTKSTGKIHYGRLTALFPNIQSVYAEELTNNEAILMFLGWKQLKELHAFGWMFNLHYGVMENLHLLPRLRRLTIDFGYNRICVEIDDPNYFKPTTPPLIARYYATDKIFQNNNVNNVTAMKIQEYPLDFHAGRIHNYVNLKHLCMPFYFSESEFNDKVLNVLTQYFINKSPLISLEFYIPWLDPHPELEVIPFDKMIRELFGVLNCDKTLTVLKFEINSHDFLTAVLQNLNNLKYVQDVHIDHYIERSEEVYLIENIKFQKMKTVKRLFFHTFSKGSSNFVNSYCLSKIPCAVKHIMHERFLHFERDVFTFKFPDA